MSTIENERRVVYTAPFDWATLLGFFRLRGIDGVECIDERRYVRSLSLQGHDVVLTLDDEPSTSSLVVRIDRGFDGWQALVLPLIRQVFDMDADLATITDRLRRDPLLAGSLRQRGLARLPGTWDPFETSMRAVLGQQVSVVAARRLIARLVTLAGTPLAHATGKGPTHRFPSPHEVFAADLAAMGMPQARIRTLKAVARAAMDDADLFRRGTTLDETIVRLSAIPGVGPWTAHYVALRACREPDAFPSGDIGLLRGMARDGIRPTPKELLALAEHWRPYRAYAAQFIWTGFEAA